jgi:hypothetical protein
LRGRGAAYRRRCVFIFFSNTLGCFGSLLVSLAGTALILIVLVVLHVI